MAELNKKITGRRKTNVCWESQHNTVEDKRPGLGPGVHQALTVWFDGQALDTESWALTRKTWKIFP